MLDDNTAVRPNLPVDVYGTYELGLVVNDGTEDSAEDICVVSTIENMPPIAVIGSATVVDNEVCLDGTGSYDPNGDPLTFMWEIVSAPAGSMAGFDDPESATPCITPDVPGEYEVELVVNDGYEDSEPARATAVVEDDNTPPVAIAGVSFVSPVDEPVCLDGSDSYDDDGDPLTFQWSLLSRPSGSTAELTGDTTVSPCITPDVAGDFQVQLIVNDGLEDSVPDTLVISGEAESLPCDLNQDGDVDGVDAGIIRAAMGTFAGGHGYIDAADFDGDGDIDYTDYRTWYSCYLASRTP